MASNADFVQYITDQCSGAGEIVTKKMFGDYGIYCNGKIFGLICDDRLLLEFLKADVLPLQTGIALQPECWATDTLILTDEDQKNLAAEAEAFLQSL